MFFNQYPYINENDLNLDYLLKHLKDLMAAVSGLETWRLAHEAEYQELKKYYDDMVNGNFTPEFLKSLKSWLEKNAFDIIGDMVKMVIFNITDDGYFVAYIPESWDEIIFNTTGLDIDLPIAPEYGHLVLSYAGNTSAY